MKLNRQNAWELLNAHLKNRNLVRHCLSVEAVMRALANHFKEDEELWGIVGLLHDGDYEETKNFPELHTIKMVQWLKEDGETNEDLFSAILSHNYSHTGKNLPADATHQALQAGPPKNNLEWSLYCCDELTGFIIAVALVKGRKISNVTVDAVLKKFPQKKFAAAVSREQIAACENKLNISLTDFIDIALTSMKNISQDLGL